MKSKQKVELLIQADSLDDQSAGVNIYTKNIIENLPQNNFHLLKIKAAHKNEISLPIRKIRLYKSLRFFYLMPEKINQLKPKVFWQPAHLLPFGIDKKIRKVITIHDLSSITMPEHHIPMNVLGHKLLLQKSIKESSGIITVSETIKQEIIKRYNPTAKIISIYNGVQKNPLIQKPKTAFPRKYFLYLGTIEPRKNILTLIKSYLEIKRKIPEKLLIIGNYGWKSNEIHELINQNPDSIIYLGFLPEAQKNYYLKNATALIYPSLYEGFGLPPLEAMQLGTPTITSNLSSLKELYQNHSLQFDPFNTSQLSKYLLQLSENESLRSELSKNGILYSQNFSWKKTATETLEFLNQFK